MRSKFIIVRNKLTDVDQSVLSFAALWLLHSNALPAPPPGLPPRPSGAILVT